MKWDVIILGAGAAGMFCAAEAGRRGRRVLLIDHAKAPGEKIRISGGGRCNFTNLEIAPERFLSENPRFAVSALKRYTQWDFIDRIDAAGIAWHEKTLGQLFCDGSSKEVIAMLTRDLQDAGVTLRLQTEVRSVKQTGNGFEIGYADDLALCDSLVVATGGKSIPKMGASAFGYRVADQFGLGVVDTRPALVPLTFGSTDLERMKALAGVSVDARVSCADACFEEGLLFTHRGLSGPSILQISSYWREGMPIEVDLSRGQSVGSAMRQARQIAGRPAVKTVLARHLPERVAADAVMRAGLTGPVADQSNKALEQLDKAVHGWTLTPIGSEGYRTAEVTLGGVSTADLDGRTMQARAVPGLYFIGEVVDVTGWLGGYNFQWAWSSGWAAGQVC